MGLWNVSELVGLRWTVLVLCAVIKVSIGPDTLFSWQRLNRLKHAKFRFSLHSLLCLAILIELRTETANSLLRRMSLPNSGLMIEI